MNWEMGCQCIMQISMENRVSAGFFVRLMAFLVDSIIASFAVAFIKIPLSLASKSIPFLSSNFLFHHNIVDIISYLGIAAYFVLLTYYTHSTLGKKLFRIEVIKKDEDWTFLNILYRETVGRFLSSLLCIGYFVIIGSKDHQGFHDMLCDTLVVYKNMYGLSEQKNDSVEKPVEVLVNMEMEAGEEPQEEVVAEAENEVDEHMDEFQNPTIEEFIASVEEEKNEDLKNE